MIHEMPSALLEIYEDTLGPSKATDGDVSGCPEVPLERLIWMYAGLHTGVLLSGGFLVVF